MYSCLQHSVNQLEWITRPTLEVNVDFQVGRSSCIMPEPSPYPTPYCCRRHISADFILLIRLHSCSVYSISSLRDSSIWSHGNDLIWLRFTCICERLETSWNEPATIESCQPRRSFTEPGLVGIPLQFYRRFLPKSTRSDWIHRNYTHLKLWPWSRDYLICSNLQQWWDPRRVRHYLTRSLEVEVRILFIPMTYLKQSSTGVTDSEFPNGYVTQTHLLTGW